MTPQPGGLRPLTSLTGVVEAPLESLTLSIEGCARCHGDGHVKLTFRPFTHPVEDGPYTFRFWAMCPVVDEPILLAFVPDASVPDEDIDPIGNDQFGL